MRDRWCSNCEREVNRSGSGTLAKLLLGFFALILPILGFFPGSILGSLAHTPTVTTLAIGDRTIALDTGALIGIGVGVLIWIVVVVALLADRPRCPICRTAALR